MSYINNLHDLMHRQLNVDDIPTIISEEHGYDIDTARELAKNMSFMDYHTLSEGDNPFGSFSKPGEKIVTGGDDSAYRMPTHVLGMDPDDMKIGDMIDYMDPRGNRHTGKVKDLPDQAGRLKVMPNDGTPDVAPPLDVNLSDISAPDDEDVQKEIQRLQQLAGIGARAPVDDPEMEESATGGASGAGGVAASINPGIRKHSPHGKAFKSARSKTSEYKRTLHKRGPKK